MSVTRELRTFDPDSIGEAMRASVPEALRALADAIDAGEIEARFISAKAHGLHDYRDTRMHLDLRIDLAAHAELAVAQPALPAEAR